MRCSGCGLENPSGTITCSGCGAPLGLDASPESFRLITCLSADISGFSLLAQQTDVEELHFLSRRYLDTLKQVIAAHGGAVGATTGDGLFAVFGWPSSHGDDAVRAVRAALEFQSRLRTELPPLAEQVRIGIASGRCVVGALATDVTGEAVILAKRLETAAEPGQVLVSEETSRQSRTAFQFADGAPLTLKGIARPVTARAVVGALAAPAAPSRPLVGRAAELTALREALAGFVNGRGGFACIGGAPGIGKTRLLWQVRQDAAALGLRACIARHTETPAPAPYAAFRQLLRDLCGAAPDAPAEATQAALVAFLQRLGPDLSAWTDLLADLLSPAPETIAPSESVSRQRALHEAIRRVFLAAAAAERAVFFIEDLHWADRATVDALGMLAEVCRHTPLLFITTYRSEFDGRARAWNPTLRLALEPLPDADSAELLTDLEGAVLPSGRLADDARARLIEVAGGNPFFLDELLRHSVESGQLSQESGAWRWTADAPADIPQTVQATIEARLDLLPESGRRVLATAAVAGRAFPVRLLERLLGERTDLANELAQLQRLDFVREVAYLPEVVMVFKHAVTREVAYGALLRFQRQRLHREVAEATEALWPDQLTERAEALAHHYREAREPLKAAEYLNTAGVRAAGLFDDEAAHTRLRDALELLETMETQDSHAVLSMRARLDNNTAVLLLRRGEMAEAVPRLLTTISALETLGDFDNLADALVNVATPLVQLGRLDEAELAAQRARGLGDERDLPIPIAASADILGMVARRRGRFAQARTLLTEAAERFHALGETEAEISSCCELALAVLALGDSSAALEHAARALADAENLAQPSILQQPLLACAEIALASGRGRDAERILDRLEPTLAVSPNRLFAAQASRLRGRWHAARGAREAARSAYEDALARFAALQAQFDLAATRREFDELPTPSAGIRQ